MGFWTLRLVKYCALPLLPWAEKRKFHPESRKSSATDPLLYDEEEECKHFAMLMFYSTQLKGED